MDSAAGTSPVSPKPVPGSRDLRQRQDAKGDVPVAPAEEAGEAVECNDEQEEDTNEDVQKNKVAPSPSLPSAAEVEEERVSHLR